MRLSLIKNISGVFFLSLIACQKMPPAPLATADFFVDNNNCIAPCTVHFFDQSTNAFTWNWNFGNGLLSTSEDDSSNYDTPGNYEVWLNVFNADGVKDSVRKTITIN